MVMPSAYRSDGIRGASPHPNENCRSMMHRVPMEQLSGDFDVRTGWQNSTFRSIVVVAMVPGKLPGRSVQTESGRI
jgi:hypothetical protein